MKGDPLSCLALATQYVLLKSAIVRWPIVMCVKVVLAIAERGIVSLGTVWRPFSSGLLKLNIRYQAGSLKLDMTIDVL